MLSRVSATGRNWNDTRAVTAIIHSFLFIYLLRNDNYNSNNESTRKWAVRIRLPLIVSCCYDDDDAVGIYRRSVSAVRFASADRHALLPDDCSWSLKPGHRRQPVNAHRRSTTNQSREKAAAGVAVGAVTSRMRLDAPIPSVTRAVTPSVRRINAARRRVVTLCDWYTE